MPSARQAAPAQLKGEIAFLRKPQAKDLARTGDSERKYVVAEYALCIKNEKAHGLIIPGVGTENFLHIKKA